MAAPSSSSSSQSSISTLLASSPRSPTETISIVTTLSAQAGSHLRDSEQPNDYYDSALALMQVIELVLQLTESLAPAQHNLILHQDPHRGLRMVDVLAAELFSLNIRLCTAFMEVGMWKLIGPRVADALELAEMSRGRFRVSAEAREWLGRMGETAEEQVGIDRGDSSATSIA